MNEQGDVVTYLMQYQVEPIKAVFIIDLFKEFSAGGSLDKAIAYLILAHINWLRKNQSGEYKGMTTNTIASLRKIVKKYTAIENREFLEKNYRAFIEKNALPSVSSTLLSDRQSGESFSSIVRGNV